MISISSTDQYIINYQTMPEQYSNIIYAEKGTHREAGFYFCSGFEQVTQVPDDVFALISAFFGPYKTKEKAIEARDSFIELEKEFSVPKPTLPKEWDVMREYYYPRFSTAFSISLFKTAENMLVIVGLL